MSEGFLERSSADLYAAGKLIEKHCEAQNHNFLICKSNFADPAACVKQGDEVIKCGFTM